MDEYITIKEIAEKWNVTPRRIQKMCTDGRIPGGSTENGEKGFIEKQETKGRTPIEKTYKRSNPLYHSNGNLMWLYNKQC